MVTFFHEKNFVKDKENTFHSLQQESAQPALSRLEATVAEEKLESSSLAKNTPAKYVFHFFPLLLPTSLKALSRLGLQTLSIIIYHCNRFHNPVESPVLLSAHALTTFTAAASCHKRMARESKPGRTSAFSQRGNDVLPTHLQHRPSCAARWGHVCSSARCPVHGSGFPGSSLTSADAGSQNCLGFP